MAGTLALVLALMARAGLLTLPIDWTCTDVTTNRRPKKPCISAYNVGGSCYAICLLKLLMKANTTNQKLDRKCNPSFIQIHHVPQHALYDGLHYTDSKTRVELNLWTGVCGMILRRG